MRNRNLQLEPLQGVPLYISEERLHVLTDALQKPAPANGEQPPAPRAAESAAGGVLVLPVKGGIFPRQGMTFSGVGLDLLRAQLRAAVSSEEVKAIVLDIDSPGGMADGLEETAELMRELRKAKPIVAHTESLAASAAYYLAAQAGEIVAGRDAMLGSIGTLIVHFSLARLAEDSGIDVNIIRNPPRKAEGNMLEPLSEQARERFQDVVDTYTGQFQADVAKGRGVPAARVRSDYGQGTVLLAREALGAGMVDRIESLEATLARLMRGRRASRTRQEGEAVAVMLEAHDPNDPADALEPEGDGAVRDGQAANAADAPDVIVPAGTTSAAEDHDLDDRDRLRLLGG